MDMTSPWLGVNNSTVPVTAPEGCLVIPFFLFFPWSHPEDLVSRQTQQDVSKFLNVYILTPLFLVSVPTNLLNMAVFWRHGPRERINLCLFSLAFADFVVVASLFEWNLDSLYSEISGTPYKLVVMKFSANNMIHSLVAFAYISGFLSTLIAFERCLCVLIPLKAQHVMHTKTTALIIVTGHVLIYAAHYVVAMKMRVVCMFDPLTNKTVDALYSSQFFVENEISEPVSRHHLRFTAARCVRGRSRRLRCRHRRPAEEHDGVAPAVLHLLRHHHFRSW